MAIRYRLSEGLTETELGGQVTGVLLFLCLHGQGMSYGGRGVPGHLRANDDAAVGDTGPIPACPVLGVLAPMLEDDAADTWRVI